MSTTAPWTSPRLPRLAPCGACALLCTESPRLWNDVAHPQLTLSPSHAKPHLFPLILPMIKVQNTPSTTFPSNALLPVPSSCQAPAPTPNTLPLGPTIPSAHDQPAANLSPLSPGLWEPSPPISLLPGSPHLLTPTNRMPDKSSKAHPWPGPFFT